MNWYKTQLNVEQLDFIIDSFIFEDASPSIKVAQYISPRLLPNFVAWKDKGWSNEQIADKFKITPKQVEQILKRHKSSHKDPVFMDKKKEQLILNEIKRVQGLNKQPSILEISKKLKIPKDVVKYVFNKNKITGVKGRREAIPKEVIALIIQVGKKYKSDDVQFSSTDIIDEVLRKTGVQVSSQTVLRALSSAGIATSSSQTDPNLKRFLYAFWAKYGGFWNTLINKSPKEKIKTINQTIDKWVYKGVTPQDKSMMKQYFLDKVQLRDKAQSHYNSRPTNFNTNWSKEDWDYIVNLLDNGWDINGIQTKTGWPINVIQEISNRYDAQKVGQPPQTHPSEMLFPRE